MGPAHRTRYHASFCSLCGTVADPGRVAHISHLHAAPCSRSLSTACVARIPDRTTPSVAVIFDAGGETAACVADVGLLEDAVTADALRVPAVASALTAAPVVMLDGNLSQAALQV